MSPDVVGGHPSTRLGVLPRPQYAHLRHMTDRIGLWEHADHSTPRREHGFCTDDNARALVITAHEWTEDLSLLAATYLRFVLDSRRPDGTFRNRRYSTGAWVGDADGDDSQGRAWWGLGAIASRKPGGWMRESSLDAFESCAVFDSPHLRANAYAALGAAEILDRAGPHQAAVDLLDRTTGRLMGAARSAIPWPEAKLTYDNGRIAEALLAGGLALGDERRTALGMRLLEWLVDTETRGSRFSFTPAAGRVPGDRGPAFDQQPIEAWAMADACRRAFVATRDPRWHELALRAGMWLLGSNDADAVMYDQVSGSTYDGLTADGVNLNRGAESTLAGLGILQVAANLGATSR
jgi:hypothetical protein